MEREDVGKKTMSTDDDVKKFADELQREIMDRARKVYTETVIDRWQNPRNFRSMDRPDGHAKAKGSCGDTMEMFIRMEGDIITDCSFSTDGCATTIACGSMATEITAGKTFTQALAKVSTEEILKRLGGLPEADVHCAQLAAEAVRRAMADALYQNKQAWKKSYRKVD